MQAIALIVLSALTLVLQGQLRAFGFPDLSLALVIAAAVKMRETQSAAYSFTIGFFEDAAYSGSFINTLVKVSVAILSASIRSLLTLNADRLCIVLAAIMTPVSMLLSSLASSFFIPDFHQSFSIFNFFYILVVNSICAPIFYNILDRIQNNEQ
ncbi:hypothetical protein HZC34_02340 [Candidatus Saganbacteria bacterium]|nr:hypothetical protein [Candidatus Saganbacteria bacterium]